VTSTAIHSLRARHGVSFAKRGFRSHMCTIRRARVPLAYIKSARPCISSPSITRACAGLCYLCARLDSTRSRIHRKRPPTARAYMACAYIETHTPLAAPCCFVYCTFVCDPRAHQFSRSSCTDVRRHYTLAHLKLSRSLSACHHKCFARPGRCRHWRLLTFQRSPSSFRDFSAEL